MADFDDIGSSACCAASASPFAVAAVCYSEYLASDETSVGLAGSYDGSDETPWYTSAAGEESSGAPW